MYWHLALWVSGSRKECNRHWKHPGWAGAAEGSVVTKDAPCRVAAVLAAPTDALPHGVTGAVLWGESQGFP